MAIRIFTLVLSVLYLCRSAAEFVRAISMGEDHGGDRAGGACAGVGEQGRVMCAVSSPYACGGLIEFVAFAGNPRREGGSAPCESVFCDSRWAKAVGRGEVRGV